MIKNFWSWLTKKGVVLTLALSFLATSLINNFTATVEKNTALLVVELTFIGTAVAVALYLFGYILFGDDWPGLEKYFAKNHHRGANNYSVVDEALQVLEEAEAKISKFSGSKEE